MKRYRPLIIMLLLCVVISTSILIFTLCKSDLPPLLNPDQETTIWNGFHKVESTQSDNQIAIQGIASPLVFLANTTEQRVNFFNPETNSCLQQLSLYVNDMCIWESGYIEPNKGYYTIELNQTLDVGTYDAYILTRCYEPDGKELNSAKVDFTLLVKGE